MNTIYAVNYKQLHQKRPKTYFVTIFFYFKICIFICNLEYDFAVNYKQFHQKRPKTYFVVLRFNGSQTHDFHSASISNIRLK